MLLCVDSAMYPTKSMLDYMTEMSLYPRNYEFGENDMFQSPTPPNVGVLNQTSMAQSSSSTETSPDSFPDLTAHQFPPEFRPETRKPIAYDRNSPWRQENRYRHDEHDSFHSEKAFQSEIGPKQASEHRKPFESNKYQEIRYGTHINPNQRNLVLAEHIYETPLIVRRQRPIMGRKIMANPEPPKPTNEFPIWQPDIPLTPPKSELNNMYELFPSDTRGFELPSPVKTSPLFRTPPRISQSPITSTPSATPPPSFSPRTSTPFKEPLIGPSSYVNYGSAKMCTFCRKNGETPLVYMTHTVKEKIDNKNVVTCPILRSHVCSTCGESGDNAHTITYCPVLRSGNNGQPLQSTTITLKNTRVKSNGRRRY